MTVAQPTPEQIEAAERFIAGPANGDPDKARKRQIMAVARMLMWCDILIAEAGAARISAPGLLEMRDWCEYCLTENAIATAPELQIDWNDPVKAAVTESNAAAASGDKTLYEAARAVEEEVRRRVAVEQAAASIQVAEKPAAELEEWA